MWDWIGKLVELRRSNQLAVLVTVTKSSGSTPRKGGAKMIVLPDGTFFGTVGGGTPEYYALEDARKCFETMQGGNSSVPLKPRGEFPACGGTMEYHMELINDDPVLYVFGAGHIGQSLAHVLEGTPFRVHLIDEREEWINAPTLPVNVIRHQCHSSDFIARATWCDKRTFAVIMTYSGGLDQEVLEQVLPRATRYVGMVGSKSKWAGVKKNLEQKGLDLSAVRCPIGHDNGGNSPREIAISIASQLLATWYGRE